MAIGTTEAGNQPSVSELASGIVDDAQRWLRQEVTLARRELETQWDRTKIAASLLVVGSTLSLFAGILFSFMIVHLLHKYGWEEWQGFGLVGLGVTIAAAVFIARGVRKLNKVSLVPERAVESIQEVTGAQ